MNKEIDLSNYDTSDGILSALPDGWREIADEMFSEGKVVKNVMVALGITRREHELYMEEEEYFNIMENGMLKSESWWIDTARDNLSEKSFNVALFNSAMSNLFRWNGKIEDKKKQKDEKEKDGKVSGYLDKYDKTQKKGDSHVQ